MSSRFRIDIRYKVVFRLTYVYFYYIIKGLMDNMKDDSPIINKIEIDESSGEPSIVSIPADQVETPHLQKNQNRKRSKKDKSAGKQLIMHGILGFSREDESINKRQKIFKNVCAVLFIILIVGVLAFTAYKDFFANEHGTPDWNEIWITLSRNWYYGLLCVFSLGLCFLLKGTKLSIMCKSMTKKWHFKTCMETAIIGHYYNSVTPLAVGGQPFEIYHLSKHGIHGGVATSLPISAYFLHQVAFITLCFTSFLLFKNNVLGVPSNFLNPFISVTAIIGLILGAIVPILVITFSLLPRFCSFLVHFVIFVGGKLKLIKKPKETTYKTLKTVVHNGKCIKKLASKPIVFIVSAIISICEHLALCSIAYYCLKMFGLIWHDNGLIEWLQVVHICEIIYVAISFIPTPGNSGAADFSFYTLFASGAGITTGLAFPAMLTWRIMSFYSFIIIGFTFITLKNRADKLHPFEEKPDDKNNN
ncbi:MAG: flippase-like domain-containing protein [Clostridiales bacterium]|nr:flippase-like domain-containing protein [Clostridiales bacterium]